MESNSASTRSRDRQPMYYALIAIAAASRLLPHPPNMVCVGALGLFAGCYLTGRRAYLVPLIAMLCSDLVGHFFGVGRVVLYEPVMMIGVYLGIAAAVPVGRWIGSGKLLFRAPAGSLIGSTLFFLISNLGCWLGGMYPSDLPGLLACFVNAIPFYGPTVIADLVFTAVLFGSYAWARQETPDPRRSTVAVVELV